MGLSRYTSPPLPAGATQTCPVCSQFLSHRLIRIGRTGLLAGSEVSCENGHRHEITERIIAGDGVQSRELWVLGKKLADLIAL